MALLEAQPVSFPAALPSPTLTNPDMILPYRSSSLSSSSSFAPRIPQQYSTRARSDSNRRGAANRGGDDSVKESMQKLWGNGVRVDRSGSDPVMPYIQNRSRDWTTGDYTVRQKSKERLFLTPSPNPDDENDYARMGDVEHPKIINGHWQGFDGPVEEVELHYHDGKPPGSPTAKSTRLKKAPPPVNGSQEIRAILDEDEDDPNSHAAMSRRAEIILANAKKRLLTMENNLSRARHGLGARPSSSMSSFSSYPPGSTPLETVPERGEPNSQSAPISRHLNSDLAVGRSKGHTRVFSETSVPSSLHTRVGHEERGGNIQEGTEASALGSGNSTQGESVRAQSADASRYWVRTGLHRDGSIPGRLQKPLEPLHEDKPASASFASSPFTSSSPSTSNQDLLASEHPWSDAPPSHLGNPQAATLTRARSTNQMRDLRDQMQDLKGKISNLKQKAREDSLRRRSLQSLRTPSPFTAAEHWYTGTSARLSAHPGERAEVIKTKDSTRDEVDETNEVSSPTGVIASSIDHHRRIGHDQDEDHRDEMEKESDVVPHRHQDSADSASIGGDSADDDLKLSNAEYGVLEEHELSKAHDAEVDPEDRLLDDNRNNEHEKIHENTSLHQTLYDSPPIFPIGERHEDRPDAFDYEHFFLHSGGISHDGKTDISRTSSDSSLYSEATTKPTPNMNEESFGTDKYSNGIIQNGIIAGSDACSNTHVRQNSGGSISTVATFATATEERETDDKRDEEKWILQYSTAGDWPPENPSKRMVNPNRGDAPRLPGLKKARDVGVATDIKKPSSTTYPVRTSSLTTPTQPLFPAAPLASSSMGLLSTLSASTPPQEGVSATTLQLRDGDKDLVERLIRSLFNVCVHLHAGSAESERYENKVWRRRLDAARRVLDGDIHGEAF